ncbi:DsbA family oxidoreductase [Salegentibacter sp. F188]|uniref:DsbA family oxidoreductase n=1 Tax=Autumnicola patrickiae TaxID=3075591 RepID=A0ABU3E459_9FLAO|nr:DsbA family oxidoreductase [Salegentibacter sp. F188]MDT0690688.1 DsbA family oxidoreductase [Salegentibacter sp. F188]
MIQVDIWSDVRCPFCYIGKHRFEAALVKFSHRKQVRVEWHSFQLDPAIETQPEISTLDYFVKAKNVSKDQAKEMFDGARKMASETGLEMDLENSVVANSYKAHLLIQLAKTKNVANQMEEALFEAHFQKAKNIDDNEVLVEIATSVGISETEAKDALNSSDFAAAVKEDELQAQKIGVRGVPFFVFNNKYAVSGAQSSESFLEVLEKVWQETSA